MKITVDLPDLKDVVSEAVNSAVAVIQSKITTWKYFTLKETAELLQIKSTTLLDKRMPFLNEIEYAQSGKLFWFLKTSVENFINARRIKKFRRVI
jgi:hypothetical protein